MSTRTIITSQPDIACEVCSRGLLRGEQPDVFLAAGRRLTVCELCAPRAVHEGWIRESESRAISLPPMRPRRGRSFIDRLRQVGGRPPGSTRRSMSGAEPDGAFELFDGYRVGEAGESAAAAEQAPIEQTHPGDLALDWDGGQATSAGESETAGQPARPSSYAEQAVAMFNASEFPRRVAGVARSLGPPVVSVRSAEHLDSVVSIVVAWELCWYRYEVDLSEPGAQAEAIGQGTELDELSRDDLLANASASELGALELVGL